MIYYVRVSTIQHPRFWEVFSEPFWRVWGKVHPYPKDPIWGDWEPSESNWTTNQSRQNRRACKEIEPELNRL